MPQKSKIPYIPIKDGPVHELLLEAIKSYGEAKALISSDNRQQYSFREIDNESHAIAASLYARGLVKGDVVAVCLPNCPEYVTIFLGTSIRGGVLSGVPPAYTTGELHRQFKDCGCKFIFTSDQLVDKVYAAVNNLPTQIQELFVVKTSQLSELPHGVTDFDELCGNTSLCPPAVKISTKSDLVLLPFSSGTTGTPKGVMISHHNVAANLSVWGNTSVYMWPTKGDHVLGLLPFYHVFGFLILLRCLQLGVTVVTVAKYDPNNFLRLLQDYKVPVLYAAPPILLLLAKNPMVSRYNLTNLHSIIAGAAPIGKELTDEILQRHPNLKYLLQAYGLTEICGPSLIMPTQANHQESAGSCGMISPHYECKVVHLSSNKELGPNQDGELLIRTKIRMVGYLNRPDATREMIDANGWIHTGDLARFDEHGCFYIVDRVKELIKVKGRQVSPAEIEDILLSHPMIEDAVVVGIPDPESGEIPRAFLVRKQNSTVSRDDILTFLQDKLAPYKRLKGGVDFVNELPKSPSGKILRRIIREQIQKSKI